MIQDTFSALSANYSDDLSLIQSLWEEIARKYSSKKRHYHDLSHLQNVLAILLAFKEQFEDWDAVLFALFYHDVIYNPLRSDNEEKSASFGTKRLKELSVPEAISDRCHRHILATKSHATSPDPDTNLFTDADLSILGQPWELYEAYFHNVRKEYSIYPDVIYKPGRKKVLAHFLDMERIFKTDVMRDRFEQQARENMQREMELL